MIYIIVPAYNEEQNIARLLSSIDEVLSSEKYAYRIIIVNDGSRDGTQGAAKELSYRYPIHLINHSSNKGIGAVFTTGLSAACSMAREDEDIIILIEADCTNEPPVLSKMISKIKEGYDIVIGSRYRAGGGYIGFPPFRYILSIGANTMLRFLFPVKGVRDYTIFFRAYKAGLIKKAFLLYGEEFITSATFVANAEVLLKLGKLSQRISEVPMIYNYSLKKGKSGMKIISTIKEYFIFIARRVLK